MSAPFLIVSDDINTGNNVESLGWVPLNITRLSWGGVNTRTVEPEFIRIGKKGRI